MPVCLCVLCVCVCGLCLCLFLCAPLGLPTLPHDPLPMWTGTELLSAHIRQEDSRTTHNTRSPAAIRRQGKRRQSGKRYTGHHHHHHPPSSSHCDSGKCHHAASSLALPILRAPLVADAPHVYLQNLEWVHRYNTKVPFLTRPTPPFSPPGLSTVYEPIFTSSLVPLALHHLLFADTVYEVPQYLRSPV